jgi:type IV pilus assembly protein PilV
MRSRQHFQLHPGQSGVVMLEALISILLFSLAVVAIVGLQAAMVTNTTGAKFRADASHIAQQRIGLMWADPVNIGAFAVANEDISNQLPGGLVTNSAPVNGQFVVTVGWTLPGETPAANDTTPPCFMAVAHCFRTAASVTGGN